MATKVKVKQKKVFVVDDNRFFLESLVFLLGRQEDIQVVGTHHRAKGVLQKIEATQPDVVILDMQLPDGDGISVLQKIRSCMDIPVIILTVYEESREQAMKNGAYAYLIKGGSLDSLYQKIREAGEMRES
mgnify:FL=1